MHIITLYAGKFLPWPESESNPLCGFVYDLAISYWLVKYPMNFLHSESTMSAGSSSLIFVT